MKQYKPLLLIAGCLVYIALCFVWPKVFISLLAFGVVAAFGGVMLLTIMISQGDRR